MKTFVIGDIHGCYENLIRMLEKLNPNLSEDRLITLGDYIDRGQDSYRVIKTLFALQEKYGKNRVVLLRGNHEQMAIDYYQNHDSCYLWNGGKSTIEDFRRHGKDLANYIGLFEQLPLFFEDEHFIYVHGGIRHGVSLSKQSESDLLWIREEFFLQRNDQAKRVIFGHTPTKHISGTWKPVIRTDIIGIDTGCVFGGYLSGIEIHDGQITSIIQVGKKAS